MNRFLVIFIIIQTINSSTIHYNYNYNIFRNSCLRLIVFKKRVSVQLRRLCKSYNNYNTKFELLNRLMYNYNCLSEDDKTILETFISTCM